MQNIEVLESNDPLRLALCELLGGELRKLLLELEEVLATPVMAAPAKPSSPLDVESLGWDTVEEPL